jgi:F-type H+-transporting ATPase subunit alpha
MKQAQYKPLPVWAMALTLFAVNNGYFDDIEVPKALAAEKALQDFAQSKHASLVKTMETEKKFSKEVEAALHTCLKDFKQSGAY